MRLAVMHRGGGAPDDVAGRLAVGPGGVTDRGAVVDALVGRVIEPQPVEARLDLLARSSLPGSRGTNSSPVSWRRAAYS